MQEKKRITANKKKKKRSYVGYLIAFWMLIISLCAAVFLLFYGASKGWLGPMPTTHDLENPEMNVASQVISADGKALGKFLLENRTPVLYEQLPEHLVQALISKEDERFFDHAGIDFKATARVIAFGGKQGGGSTITQQLAKLLFTEKPSKNLFKRAIQKVKEWVLAISLERRYTKEEIIIMYFNKFDFLYNSNGIESAAQTYFSKPVKDLNLVESATLVGLLENPNFYNPKKNLERANQQRNRVLEKMVRNGYISKAQYEAVRLDPIKLNFKRHDEQKNLSIYYRNYLSKEVNKILDDYNRANNKNLSIYKDGLRIYVTIDSRMQTNAEQAVIKHLKYLQSIFFREMRYNPNAPYYGITKAQAQYLFKVAMRRTQRYRSLKEQGIEEDSILSIFNKKIPLQIFTWSGMRDTLMSPWDSIRYHKHILQSGLVSMEPQTGFIKAWVGGLDYRHFKYDHVKQSRRQVGSIFKPILYVTAINQMNYSPCTRISNERVSIGSWNPRNASGRYGGYMALKDALAYSVNMISVRLIKQIGTSTVIRMARNMGIDSPIPNNFTISLGTAEITLYEMVGAYNVFANKGIYIKPQLIWRIEDKDGNVVKEASAFTREVLSEEKAYLMLYLMKNVVDYGTAKRMRNYNLSNPIAGKTGTTNDNSDGWFIGIVPNLVTGVWVGAEDRFAHFRSTAIGQGASMALPIWAYYMKANYAHKSLYVSNSDFEKPPTGNAVLDCSNYTGYDPFEANEYKNTNDDELHINKPRIKKQKKIESVDWDN